MKRITYILTILILTSCQMRNAWECEGDCYNGEGIKKWRDGGIERGIWENGELTNNGYQFIGKTSDFAGDSYEGEFINGRYHGFGTYLSPSKDAIHTGQWENGKANGKGKLTFGPKATYPFRYYDGQWKNGMRHGYGVKFWGEAGENTNNKYEGEWKNDEINGFGKYEWLNIGTYIGPWKNGVQHGEGIFIFPNGDTLKSRWFEGYCKDLAVLKTGKDPSYFETHIRELNFSSFETVKYFVDETSKELLRKENDSSYQVYYIRLRKLLDTALINQKEALPKLELINEYDNKIPYKRNILNLQYAFLDFLYACDNWIKLTMENEKEELIQNSYGRVQEKAKIVKQKQNEFKTTKQKFNKKYN